MNILFAMPWDQAEGGVTHVAASLAQSLKHRGHDVCFLYPAEGWRLRKGTSRRGLRAIWCRLRDYPSGNAGFRGRVSWVSSVATALPQRIRFGRDGQIDPLNVRYPTPGSARMVDGARRLGIPLVV